MLECDTASHGTDHALWTFVGHEMKPSDIREARTVLHPSRELDCSQMICHHRQYHGCCAKADRGAMFRMALA